MAFRKSPEPKRGAVQLANARHLDMGNAAKCIIDRSQFCVPTANCTDCPNNGTKSVGTNSLISADAIRTLNLRSA